MRRGKVLALLSGFCALLFCAGLFLPGQSKNEVRATERQQDILKDLKDLSDFVDEHKEKHGVIPDENQLDDWAKSQRFRVLRYSPGVGVPVGVVDADPGCRAPEAGQCTYRLLYHHDAGHFVDDYLFDPAGGEGRMNGTKLLL